MEAATVLQPPLLGRSYACAPLPTLLHAAARRQTLRLDYESRSGGRRAWRMVDPYAMELREGVWWELHGWCHENAGFRTFACDRVYAAEVLPEAFVRREREWEEFWKRQGVGGLRGGAQEAPTPVRVRFAPDLDGRCVLFSSHDYPHYPP